MARSNRGRDAHKPSRIPFEGWKDILWRVKGRIAADRVSLVAAGTAFYLLLALFPGLAALVSIYGLLADPAAVAGQIASLSAVMPADGLDIVNEQLTRLVEQAAGSLSFGVVFGVGAALWSANNGVKALVQAMNVAYREREKRSFIRLTLFTLGATLGVLLFVAVFISVIGVLPVVMATVGLADEMEWLLSLLRWPLLILLSAFAISLIYRYAPSRRPAKWRWITWGSGLATIVWVVGSMLFSWYLSNFASYNQTYGSIGAVIGLMLWMWLSVMILIIGAEIDAEMEHQTEEDSTVGEDRPMGERGAVVADTLGDARNSS